MKRVYTLILSLLLCTPILAQVGVINSPPLISDTLAQRLVGYGLEISNAQLSCAHGRSGYFFGATAAGFPMNSGILLTSGSTAVALSPNNSGSATAAGGPGYGPLEEFPNAYNGTFNACVLEFDFTPQGDTIKFNYVFGSEEYPEYVGSVFNDIFAFLIEGFPEYPPEMSVIERNIAIIPDSPGINVAINFLNFAAYSQFYIDNTDPTQPSYSYIQYDGFTTNLTAKAKVTPCNTYHLTLAIADVSDTAWDSGVFLEEGSFISNTFFVEPPISDISEVEELDFVVENCGVGEVTFRTEFPTEDGYSLPLVTAQNVNNPDAIVVGGSAQLFLDYTLSDSSVEIPENGTEATIEIYPIVDGIAEEDEYITFAFFASCSTVPYAVDTFWIYDEIKAVVPEDIDICDAGTEVQLYGWESNGLNLEQDRFYIRWEPSEGLSCTDCLDPIATINETSTYTFIIGYEGTICSDQESITVNVDPNTSNFDALPDFTICANQTTTLSASGGLDYEWLTPDGQDAENLSCIDCPNPTFTPPNNDGATYIYNVIVSSGPGCAEEFPVEVTVDWADLSVEPVDPICPGDFATLSVASGDGSNFVWTKTNGLPAGNGPSIEVNPATTTTYTVVALDVACPNPKSVTLVVDQVDAAFNPVQTVCAGETATLVGQGGQLYQWLDAEGNVLSNSQTYNPVIEENTTFQLVAQNNNCFDTIPVLAAIEPIRTIEVITANPIICGGITSVDLAVEPITGVTFTWEPAGAFTVANGDGSIVTATPPDGVESFTYTVTAVTPLGCTPPQTIDVTVGTDLEITVDAPEVLCIDLANPEIYNINAFGAASYTWGPLGPIIANPGESTAILIPNPANNNVTFTVFGTDEAGICTGETSFTVQVFQEPELTVNSPVVCAGESATLTAEITDGSGNFSYEWIPTTGLANPNSSSTEVTVEEPTTYTLIAIDIDGGCEVQQEVLVEVNQYPDVTLVETVAACNGEEVTITAEGGDGFAMTWTDGSGAFVTSGPSLTVSPTTTTTYNLEVGTDCPVELPTTIEIIEVEVDLVASAAQICDGEQVQLEASGDGIATFEWTQANGLSGTTGTNQTASPTSTTTYIVTGFDAGGNCTATAEVTVEVANIQVQIPPDPFTCGADDPAVLTINGGDGATYLWDPPTGLSSTTDGTVTATPSETTQYNVQVTNAEGCEETVFVTVNVFPPIEISVAPPFVSLCPGETATYTLTGAATYDFEEINGGSFQVLSNENGVVEITANTNASFNIVGISENGCRAETTAELAVNTPVVSAGGDASICEGESTELFAEGGVGATYQWNNADSMDDPNSATPSVFPTTTTNYDVVITDNNGCSATEQVTVVISQPAFAELTVTPDAICPGTAVVLQAAGNGVSTYSFYDQTGELVAENTNGQTVVIPTENMTYTLVVTTPDGCTDEAVASVDFNEDPVLEAQDGIACPDGSTIMTVSGAGTGATYNWTPNNILVCNNADCSSVTVSPTNATPVNFTITGTTAAGCSAETQAMVSTEAALSITVSPANPELCIGETITLNAGGATDFTWEGDGLSATTGQSVEVDINASGTYEYTLIGTDGECSGNTTFSVVINDLPTIEADLAPTLCVGDEHTLTATGGVDYEWTLNGDAVGNLNVSPLTTTTYDVIGTDANGCSNVSQVTVEVEEPIQLSVTTNDEEICFGNSTSIMATGAVSFEWSTTDETGDGELLNVSPDVTTTYTVIATSANGCTAEGEVTVEVLEPDVALAAAQTGFCTGDNTSLTATGTGNYTWEGEGITGSGPSVSIQPVTPGLYTYIVTTDINGCTATADVQIEVYAEPEINVPQLLQICKDGSTEITAIGADTDTFEWIDPNGSLSGTTGGTVTASPIAGTTYTVVSTSINGCTTTAEVNVAVGEELLLDAQDQAICIGDAGGATLTVAGADDYTWTGDDLSALSATTGNSVIATPSVTTTYTIVGTDEQGCSGETEVTVVVNELPQADAGAPGMICIGDDYQLTASGGTQFIWDDPTGTLDNPNIATPRATPTEPTTYTVTVINDNGCSSTSEVFVDLEPIATAEVPASGETCSNAIFDITGAVAENATSITWTSSGNGTFTDANNLETSYQPDASDVGTVILTMNVEGCGSNSPSFELTVKQSTAELGFDPTIPVCPGISIPIAGANIGIGDINNISWSGGEGSFENIGELITEYRPAEGEVGTIVLTLTADDECGTVSDQITVEVLPLVNVDAGDDDRITEGESTNLEASGGLTDQSYIWTVAEGFDPLTAGLDESQANLQSPLVTPTATTTYQLASSDNCSDVATVVVEVLPTGQITMPNAFSPNNDGVNDLIFPVGFNFELLGFRIYSRWGEKVFETDVPNEGWDGFYLGEPAELGAYAYVVEYSLNGTNTTEILAGSITLIR